MIPSLVLIQGCLIAGALWVGGQFILKSFAYVTAFGKTYLGFVTFA